MDDSTGSGVPYVCLIQMEKVLFREKGSRIKMSHVVPFGDWLQQLSWWGYLGLNEDPVSVINH